MADEARSGRLSSSRGWQGGSTAVGEDLQGGLDPEQQLSAVESIDDWMQPEARKGVADANNRRKFAEHIRAARGREDRAVEHLEKALAVLRG